MQASGTVEKPEIEKPEDIVPKPDTVHVDNSIVPMDLSKDKTGNQALPDAGEKDWPALLPKAVPPAHSSGGQDPNIHVRTQDMAHGPANRSVPELDGYARVLTNGEKKENKEKKQPKDRPQPNKQFPRSGNGSTFNLAGAPKIVTTELYLENLRVPSGSSNKAIMASVTNHGKKNQIRILNCWVRRNRYVKDVVGCKITVPSTQANKCKVQPIWPEHVSCRDWFSRHELMGSQQPRSRDTSEDRPNSRPWGGDRDNTRRAYKRPNRPFDLDRTSGFSRDRGDYYDQYERWADDKWDSEYKDRRGWSDETWDEFMDPGHSSRE